MQIYKHEILGNLYSLRWGLWIIVASLIFSLVAYLLLTDKELSLLDQGEMLYTLGQIIIAIGIVIAAITASSGISGEIESGTIENILLTPIKFRTIAIEKVLAVITSWVILFIVSVPYLVVLSNGTNFADPSVFYVGIFGTMLVSGISLISISLSILLTSSKNSIMTAIMIVLVLLAPSLFFGSSLKKTDFGIFLENVNPASHAINSLDSVLVDNEIKLQQQTIHLFAISIFLIVSIFVFLYWTRDFELKVMK
jgi:ABC-2 type transport system permease protein